MHTPLRMCVVCRKHRPTEELLRITIDKKTSAPKIDGDKKNDGRGAYICRNKMCIEKAEKKHILERHLKCNASDTLYREAEGLV